VCPAGRCSQRPVGPAVGAASPPRPGPDRGGNGGPTADGATIMAVYHLTAAWPSSRLRSSEGRGAHRACAPRPIQAGKIERAGSVRSILRAIFSQCALLL
jgi:hypothetical protein